MTKNIINMPDARYNHQGVLHPVTHGARSWLYQNTNAKKSFKNSASIPKSLLVTDDLVEMMREDGLIVR